MLAGDAAEPAAMLMRHSRDVYGNGEDWDPAVNLGMFSWSLGTVYKDRCTQYKIIGTGQNDPWTCLLYTSDAADE